MCEYVLSTPVLRNHLMLQHSMLSLSATYITVYGVRIVNVSSLYTNNSGMSFHCIRCLLECDSFDDKCD